MATSIEAFKQAFAGQKSGDDLTMHDRSFAKALKRLDRSIDAAGSSGAADGVRSVRETLVERYRSMRGRSGGSAKATADQLEEVLRQLKAVNAKVEAAAANAVESAPPQLQETEESPEAKQEKTPAGSASQFESELLRNGDKGPAVEHLQKQLNKQGGTVETDGKFGAKTKKAVKAFQKSQGLKTDGVVGANTWKALTVGNKDGGEEGLQPVVVATVEVREAVSGEPIVGASVEIEGETKPSRTGGLVTFSLLPGTHRVTVTAVGYEDASRDFEVTTGQAENRAVVPLELQVIRPASGQVALFVRVTDAETRRPLTGARVRVGEQTISEGPNDGDRWRFVVPTTGPYTYEIEADSYQPADGRIVAVDSTTQPPTQLDVPLQRDTTPVPVMITVTDVTTNDAIDNATVEVAGRPERTGNTGLASFSLPPGPHSVRVSANGYDAQTVTVEVTAGRAQIARQIQLQPAAGGSAGSGGNSGSGGSGGGSASPPLQDRTVSRLITIPRDYQRFRSEVVTWIRRFVVDSRAEELVDESNLRDFHATAEAIRALDQEIRLEARLRAGRWRYESIDFNGGGARR